MMILGNYHAVLRELLLTKNTCELHVHRSDTDYDLENNRTGKGSSWL